VAGSKVNFTFTFTLTISDYKQESSSYLTDNMCVALRRINRAMMYGEVKVEICTFFGMLGNVE
jgi:hypothetical protein